jgi:outer membrane murein-binding lipoprotein Lpp
LIFLVGGISQDKGKEGAMKLLRSTCVLMGAFMLAGIISPPLRAQDQTSNSAAASGSDVSAKIEELQKEMDQLKAQLDQLKQEKEKAAASASVTSAAPAAPAATTPPASKPSVATTLFDSTAISGYVDGYYGYDANHPADRQAGLRVFDNYTNQFSLNLAKLVISRTPDASTSRLGYNLSFGYGNAINVVNGSESAAALGGSFDRNVEQAYLSYLAPIGKGLQLDFGKFVTPAGAEVIESNANWNYSRGILFGYAIPFYHFGLRAAYPLNPKVTLTGFLVNAWNDVVAPNTGRTYGFSLAWAPSSKVSVTQNYLGGPQMLDTNSHWRNLTDTVIQFNVTPKLSLLENFDWGGGDMIVNQANSVHWVGIATYARYAFNDAYAFAVRYEYYDDHDGFTTGTAQHIHEYTATLERTFAQHLVARLEFRRDMSNTPFFPRGVAELSKNQDTVDLGLMYQFDIHAAK